MAENVTNLLENFNRVAKIDLDAGLVADADHALARLTRYRVNVVAGPEIGSNPALQTALLTFVNIAVRFALGGVQVSGIDGEACLTPFPAEDKLASAIIALGGIVSGPDPDAPTVVFGTPDAPAAGRSISVTFEGWRGGVAAGTRRLSDETTVTAAAVMAGALGACEAFGMLRGEVMAGRRDLGLSLWRPEMDWRDPSADGPPLDILPSDLWIMGLGHLGQAFLWILALCPYARPHEVRLVLQDVDTVSGSTASTSILTRPRYRLGSLKTRAVAEVLEQRGFKTALVERPFDGGMRRRPEDDPAVLVCGVDNALARRQLETAGFPLIVEAGLGRTATDFRAMRLHSFPQIKAANELWTVTGSAPSPDFDRPAYRRLKDEGADECGLTQFAQTAVGAPFVGTIAGAMMFAEIARVLLGDHAHAVLDLDLQSPATRRAVPNSALPPLALAFQAVRSS
jgi:hypothetical protein